MASKYIYTSVCKDIPSAVLRLALDLEVTVSDASGALIFQMRSPRNMLLADLDSTSTFGRYRGQCITN